MDGFFYIFVMQTPTRCSEKATPFGNRIGWVDCKLEKGSKSITMIQTKPSQLWLRFFDGQDDLKKSFTIIYTLNNE